MTTSRKTGSIPKECQTHECPDGGKTFGGEHQFDDALGSYHTSVGGQLDEGYAEDTT